MLSEAFYVKRIYKEGQFRGRVQFHICYISNHVEIKLKVSLENNEILCDCNDDAYGKDSDGDVADNHVLGNHLFRSVGPTQPN